MPRNIRLSVVIVLIIGFAAAAAEARPRRPARAQWDHLGERVVSDQLDHDTIVVTAAEGIFSELQLRVEDRAVEFRRVVVHYANGEEQEIPLRVSIRAGGKSRAIDLEGNRRVIQSVDLWYDAQSIGRGGTATVHLFGRH